MTSFPAVDHVPPENGSGQVWNPNCHLVSIIIPLPTNHRDLAVPHGEVATQHRWATSLGPPPRCRITTGHDLVTGHTRPATSETDQP
jgi:hypothetical protein